MFDGIGDCLGPAKFVELGIPVEGHDGLGVVQRCTAQSVMSYCEPHPSVLTIL